MLIGLDLANVHLECLKHLVVSLYALSIVTLILTLMPRYVIWVRSPAWLLIVLSACWSWTGQFPRSLFAVGQRLCSFPWHGAEGMSMYRNCTQSCLECNKIICVLVGFQLANSHKDCFAESCSLTSMSDVNISKQHI